MQGEKVSLSLKNQPEKNNSPRIVVIGVGNLLLKDEGIGIHAVEALQGIELPPDVRLIDGGTSPDLIAYTKAGDKLIIIDAAKAGGEPGTIYRFRPEDLAEEKGVLTSAHELGVAQNLSLMSLLGNKPAETVIIGIEPEEIDPGLELSTKLQQKLPDIVKVVLKEIGLR
jgi:hydrogenase maturation protease